MKALKISLTVVVELALIYLFSLLVGWSFIETFFLGSLAIFAIMWLIIMSNHRNNITDHAISKTLTGVETGEIKPFKIVLTPSIMGTLSLVLVSFIVTAIYYLPISYKNTRELSRVFLLCTRNVFTFTSVDDKHFAFVNEDWYLYNKTSF